MQRSNDNQNQSIEEMKRTTALLGQRVNQLERLLDQKGINEAKVESGTVYQRESRMSLSNGMTRTNWQSTDVSGSGSGDDVTYNDLIIIISYWEFGVYSITSKVVRVNAGEVNDSLLNTKTAGAADITVADSGTTYIFLEYTYGGTLSIKGSTARPVMDATTYRRILHKWTVVDGVAVLGTVSHLGNIVIPGTFASEA